MIFLSLILTFQMAAQTLPGSQKIGIQQPAIKPAVIAVPQAGSAVISVRDASGNPVSGATISATFGGRTLNMLTNAQGDASLNNIAVGQYIYTVSREGYYSPLANMTLSIAGGATTASKYILFQYGRASVNVTSGGTPVAGADVNATKYGQLINQGIRLKTDANGTAIFNGLTQESYNFSASKDGYIYNSSSMNIVSGQEAKVPIAIVKYGSAKVKVTSEGTLVSGATVSTTVNGKSMVQTTDANGMASFSSLTPGNYVFSAAKPPYAGQPATVSIANGQDANITIPFIINYGAVAASVTERDSGAPISGALVKVVSADGKIQSATTNSQGMATFSKVPSGFNTAEVSKADYAAVNQKVSAYIAGSETCQSKFSMYKICVNIGVTVKSAASQGGQPLLGATVSLLGPGVSQSLATDSQGKVKFMCQKFGSYIVSANKTGYIGSSQNVTANNMGMVYDLIMEMSAAK
jgi:hypothetical protein